MNKIGVLLSGCGVFDGSEIHEAVFTLLCIAQHGDQAIIMAPNRSQLHVVNHVTGDEMDDSRNVLTESARIARGNITDAAMVGAKDFDALIIPGGFGSAKNFSTWSIDNVNASVDPDVKRIVQEALEGNKPIVALCISPVIISCILSGTGRSPRLTVGTTKETSPYDIAEIHSAMSSQGTITFEESVRGVVVDKANKIISAPCYMMDAGPDTVHANVRQAIDAMYGFLN